MQLSVLSLANNSLTGPAFPVAGLQVTKDKTPPQGLAVYDVSGNAALSGTLPAELPWPYLTTL